ncbi:MAG: LysR family transcriptional regulator, partial [Rhodobacteraceae bacterium]|nr:LysR family transcriptional regulator [Paracoccaceae bacterium]
CFVTQSTLSTGIQELEALLGAPLAERTRRTVMLTPLGLRMAGHARKILQMAEDMVDLAQAEVGIFASEIQLGVIPTIAPFVLPRALPKIQQNYPELKLYVTEDQTARLLDRLRKGELDAVLLALPYPAEGIESQVISDDWFQLACPSSHPLAGRKSVSKDDLEGEPLMLLSDGHCLREHALAACHLEGRAKMANFEAASLQTLVQMVACGLGLTFLPQMAIDAGLVSGLDIALVPLAANSQSRQIGLAWRSSSVRCDELRKFSEFFR